jgi:hypothetical protein
MERLYQNAYSADKLAYPLTTWTHVPFQSQSLVDAFRVETVNNSNRAIIVIPRLVNRLLDPNVDSFQRTAQSLKYVQISIGSNLLKRYTVDGGAPEIMSQIQKMLDFSNTGSVTPYNFACQLPGLTAAQEAVKSSKFIIGQSLETSLFDDTILSGCARLPITISVEYASPIQPTQYDVFILSDISLQCGATIGSRVLV